MNKLNTVEAMRAIIWLSRLPSNLQQRIADLLHRNTGTLVWDYSHMPKKFKMLKRKQPSKKKCAMCDCVKPIKNFNYLSSADQYHSYCKECHSDYCRIRYNSKK